MKYGIYWPNWGNMKKIGYLGPKGTFTDEAAYKYAENENRIEYSSFLHLFHDLVKKQTCAIPDRISNLTSIDLYNLYITICIRNETHTCN